jgi:hypothetical protein
MRLPEVRLSGPTVGTAICQKSLTSSDTILAWTRMGVAAMG